MSANPDRAVRLPGLQQAFAHAVASDGLAYRLDASNARIPGAVTVDVASAADDAFFVTVDDTILAVDFDQADGEARAARLYLLLRERGLLPVITRSGAPGHRHLFCLLQARDRVEAVSTARQLDGDVRRTIRPPLARHRRDGHSSLQLPADPDEALGRLKSGRGAPLTERTRHRIHVDPGGDVDKSEMITKVAWGAANKGWSWEEFELLLLTPDTAVHKIFRERCRQRGWSPERARTWALRYVWEPAAAGVEARPASGGDDTPRLDVLLSHDYSAAWEGKAGPTARVVYLALVQIHLRCGVMPFNASQRELAEMAGIGSRNSVSAALTRLIRDGVIVQKAGLRTSARTDAGVADAWRFGTSILELAPPSDSVSRFPLQHLGHDLFHVRELGKTAQLVYDRVGVSPGATEDIARLSGRSRRTTLSILTTLAHRGLVRRSDSGAWAITGADLDQVAELWDTAPHSHTRRQRHDRERRDYLTWRTGEAVTARGPRRQPASTEHPAEGEPPPTLGGV